MKDTMIFRVQLTEAEEKAFYEFFVVISSIHQNEIFPDKIEDLAMMMQNADQFRSKINPIDHILELTDLPTVYQFIELCKNNTDLNAYILSNELVRKLLNKIQIYYYAHIEMQNIIAKASELAEELDNEHNDGNEILEFDIKSSDI